MNMDQVGGIIRTILAAGGGYLVSKGYLDNATMLSLVGAVVTIITGAWSIYAKRGSATPTA